MTLSADIRRGAEMTVKITERLGYKIPGDTTVQACAFGAALYGSGVFKLDESIDYSYVEMGGGVIKRHYSHLIGIEVISPCNCGMGFYPLSTIIMHLNDIEDWTREAIADWLESLGY